jgi:thiamine-monophosphate kinase
MASHTEFDIIANIFRPLTNRDPKSFDLMDDAALVEVHEGYDLVVTKDALVEGVHFLITDPPDRVAQKLMRVNLSDLAAKGAQPLSYVLACAWPHDVSITWIKKFARGLAADQLEFGLHLLGGDTVATRGNMTLTLTAFGSVAHGGFIERKGARPGDELWVTGTIGDAALGLELLQGQRSLDNSDYRAFLQNRYQLPQPRLKMGQALSGLATSCVDVSDGLVADADHIAVRSDVNLVIEMHAVPLSDAARACDIEKAFLMGAGDDYELLFTLPPTKRDDALKASKEMGVALTQIGHIESGEGVVVEDESGAPIAISHAGYQHFE